VPIALPPLVGEGGHSPIPSRTYRERQLRVMGCRCEYVGTTTAVPQIAAERDRNRKSRSIAGWRHRSGNGAPIGKNALPATRGAAKRQLPPNELGDPFLGSVLSGLDHLPGILGLVLMARQLQGGPIDLVEPPPSDHHDRTAAGSDLFAASMAR
jgi:hypothetical protein